MTKTQMELNADILAENKELKMRLGDILPDRAFLAKFGAAVVTGSKHEEYCWLGVAWACDLVVEGDYVYWNSYKIKGETFRVYTECSEGQFHFRCYAPTLEHAKAACQELDLLEGGDTPYISTVEGDVAVWVTDEDDETGSWESPSQ